MFNIESVKLIENRVRQIPSNFPHKSAWIKESNFIKVLPHYSQRKKKAALTSKSLLFSLIFIISA